VVSFIRVLEERMSRRPNLTQAIERPHPAAVPEIDAPPPVPEKKVIEARRGKRSVNFWMLELDWVEWHVGMRRAGMSVQAACIEAIEEWCERRNIRLPSKGE
jgi:hypothetical protein